MIKFISFEAIELGSELGDDERISIGPISITKNERVAKVNSIGGKIIDRKD